MLVPQLPLRPLNQHFCLGWEFLQALNQSCSKRIHPGRPTILSDLRVGETIEYLSESWDKRTLNYSMIVEELKLPYSAAGLELRLKQREYYRCG
jgi:hypothetical protein